MSARWCTVAPISYHDRNKLLEKGFQFSDEVSISLYPSWLSDPGFKRQLSSDIEAIVDNNQFVLISQYEGHSLSDTDPSWTGDEPRTMEDKAFEEIQLATLALWISRPSLISFKTLIQAAKVNTEWRRVLHFHFKGLSAHPRDIQTVLTIDDLEMSRDLFRQIKNLPRRGSVWVSLRTTLEALTEDWWEGRFLFLWVALEALFGPKDAREVSYRLSQRMGFFLAHDSAESKSIFSEMRKSYGWRSKVAHGVALNKLSPKTSEEILWRTEEILRRVLIQILLNPDVIKSFNGSTREEFLDSLVFTFNNVIEHK